MMTCTTLVCHSPAGSPFERCVGECPLTIVLREPTRETFAVMPVVRVRAADPRRPERSAVPAIIARDVAAPYASCARPARPPAPAGRDGVRQSCQRPCARRRSSPTPRCAGCWKSSTAVVRRPSCGRCWHPASSTRCCRPAGRSPGRAPHRKPPRCCAGCACNPPGDTTRTPGIDAAEVFGTYSRGNRIHAIACRVEQMPAGSGTRWLVVALHIG